MDLCFFKEKIFLGKYYVALLMLLFIAFGTYIFSEYKVIGEWELCTPNNKFSNAFITDSNLLFIVPQTPFSEPNSVDTNLLECYSFQGTKRWQTKIAFVGKPTISVINDNYLIFSFRNDNRTKFIRVNCKDGEKKFSSISSVKYHSITMIDSVNALTVNIDSLKNKCALNKIDIFTEKTDELYCGPMIIDHLGNEIELNDKALNGLGYIKKNAKDTCFSSSWYHFSIKNGELTIRLSLIQVENICIQQLDSRFYKMDDCILYTSHFWEKKLGRKPQNTILLLKNIKGKVITDTLATIPPEYIMLNYYKRCILFVDKNKTKACIMVLNKI